MAWIQDPYQQYGHDQQGNYQDPYQQYGQDQQGNYQDPYQQYSQDQQGNYANYEFDPYQQQHQEDTESEKLRKDELERERIVALESNRLYLKKIKEHCVKEDFADLDRLQLFLFEVLVERMEVSSESVLGLVSDNDQLSYISVRVQFLNSPWMEICERDMLLEGITQENSAETEYLNTIGEAGQKTYSGSYNKDMIKAGESGEEGEEQQASEVKFTTKWESASGKSCLFSETPMMIIRDMEKLPVVLQALRCVVSKDGKESCEPIGYAQVRLPEDFSLSVIQSSKADVILPVSSVHRVTLDITNVFGVKKGRVDLFLRLSSFGPAIITSFQSSGQDRKYTFKPSPLDSNFKTANETTSPSRSELLKPIIAEEEQTVGIITVQKEYDVFQKPVLWKRTDGSNQCVGCRNGKEDNHRVSRLSSLGSLRLPLSSDISLCKNVLPRSVLRKLKFDNPSCDWHSLVSAGIKNSPGGNCGCLDSARAKSKGSPGDSGEDRELKRKNSVVPSTATRVSRVYKMTIQDDHQPLVKGFGLPKECTDCGCDCPFIKEALDTKKLFLI